MGRCWGSNFFQHVLHSFNTGFFISQKLLTNMTKQLNKEHQPILANSKKLSSSEGPLQQTEENDALEFGSLILQKALFKTEKKSAHAQRRFYIKKAQILFSFLNNAPSFLPLRWALSRARRFLVRHLFTEHLQNTTNVLPRACKVPFPATDWANNSVSLWISFL